MVELLFAIIFVLAVCLFLILSIANFILVTIKGKGKGYFFNTSLNFDIFANRELKTLWNATLIKKVGYEFGRKGETISSALGKNQRLGTLSKVGKGLVKFLDFVDKNHCEKSIMIFEDEKLHYQSAK